jgi:DNA-binding response OmpR family regulator
VVGIRRILVLSDTCHIDIDGLIAELDAAQYQVIVVESIQEAHDWMTQRGLPHLLIVAFAPSHLDYLKFSHEVVESTGLPLLLIADNLIPLGEALDALRNADDLVCCQYATPQELVLRIRRILSRIGDFSYATGPSIKITDWLSADMAGHTVTLHGETRKLTPTENSLLNILLAYRGEVVDFERFFEWISAVNPTMRDKNALRVHMHRLRKKIGDNSENPAMILTERGVGYRLTE